MCGSADSLEIDHIDYESKSFSVSRLWGVNESDFWAEIGKCQLLCSEHHVEKTKVESSLRHPITHGKYWAAYKYKCGCEVCVAYRDATNLARRQARASNSIGRVPSF